MRQPTLSPAVQAPIWARLIAWAVEVCGRLRVSAETTVRDLKQAYLAAGDRDRSNMRSNLRAVEFLVRRMLVAAALALRLEPPSGKPTRAGAPAPLATTIPPASLAPNSLARTPPAAPPAAPDVANELANHRRWLKTCRHPEPAAWTIEAEAEDFARRFLDLARLLANPDSAILDLARRLIGNPRQAIADVANWEKDVFGSLSSYDWNKEFNATRASLLAELEGFRLHVEPG